LGVDLELVKFGRSEISTSASADTDKKPISREKSAMRRGRPSGSKRNAASNAVASVKRDAGAARHCFAVGLGIDAAHLAGAAAIAA
jgi:hypothetical protein